MYIYLAVAIVSIWLVMVGMYINPSNTKTESTVITSNMTDDNLQKKLQDLQSSDTHQTIEILVSSNDTVKLRINVTNVCGIHIAHKHFDLITSLLHLCLIN